MFRTLLASTACCTWRSPISVLQLSPHAPLGFYWHLSGVSQQPLTPIFPRKYRDTNGRRMPDRWATYIYIYIYIYVCVCVPHTSPGGQFLGFEMHRSRGKNKQQGRKRLKKRKTRKEKTDSQVAVNLGPFYYRTGENVAFLTQICLVTNWGVRKKQKKIYIYIYYAVKLLSGPSLGVFGSYYLVQVGFLEVIIWSKFVFLAYKNRGFKRFVLHTQLSFCVFFFVPNFLAIF